MNYNTLLEAALFSPNSLQSPDAWIGHLPFAAWLIKEKSPRLLVELGTHSGNSYFTFCQAVTETNLSTQCYAVDTWKGEKHSGFYGEKIFEDVFEYNKMYYAKFSQLLRMTFDEAVTYFSEKSIDLLHIDGLHTYEAVKHDFELWSPKLAPGAIVVFHDINVRDRDFGVWKLWEEIRAKNPLTIEFQHSNGLGILQIDDANGKKLSCFSFRESEKQLMKNYFAALGSRQIERYKIDSLNQLLYEQQEKIDFYQSQLEERDEQIAKLQFTIDEINSSNIWKITRPYRVMKSKMTI